MFLAHAAAAQAPVDLGTATNFAVLASAGITIAASGTTMIEGDIGSYPTVTIAGTENLTLNGINDIMLPATAIPEPGTLWRLGSGLATMRVIKRRRTLSRG